MARNKTSDDFLHENEEYVKLRSGQPPGETFREQPQRQGAGGEGYDRPLLESWTTPELRSHALQLNISGASDHERDSLIDAILAQQAPRARSTRDE